MTNLPLNFRDIIIRHPLVAHVGIRPDSALRVTGHRPRFLFDPLADLVEGEKTTSPCELACLTRSVRLGVEAPFGRVGQREGLAVQGHAHDEFAGWGALFDPVVDGEVLWRRKRRVLIGFVGGKKKS